MNRSRLLALALCAASVPGVFAVETKTWTHNDQPDFEKGTLHNLSLRSNGRLSVGPVFRELVDPATAYLWALAEDSHGTLYAGGGGPGASTAKLFAIDRQGKSRVAAELPGLQIQAIAIDQKDHVYAATSPDGKVYRIGAGGKFDVFYDPKAKYIWALAVNSRGDLFVATGDSGEIHKVTPDGKGSVFFRTEETHARSLAIDAKDYLIVGTEPGGLIIRVSPAAEGFVLYQTAKREVTSVAVSRDGVIYAAAVGGKTGSSSPPPPPAISASPAPTGAASASTAARTPASPSAPPPASTASTSVSGGSELYRIGTDNYPQRIWSHPQDVIYAIAFDSNGRPVIGTGNKGNIYRIDSDLISTLLVNAAPTQITAFASNSKGGLFAATGNVGKVYQVGPEIEKQGSYESEPLDVGSFAYWGRLRQKSTLNGGKLLMETRTGNLDRPQKNWSAWQAVDPATGRVVSPSARFIQYRATLTTAPQGQSPEINAIELAYMPKNVAPRFDEIESTPANYRFPAPAALSTSAAPTITLPALGQPRRPFVPALSIQSLSSSQTMTYAKGHIGARWAVTEPNGDDMTFKVEIRGANEKQWKLLRDKVTEKYISWDSTAYPDGVYHLRVTASDIPDNPPDQALSSSIESDAFTIDNTPPQISGATAARSGNRVTARWHAKDALSIISRAEYSVNGGEWVVVEPATRLSDSPELDYSVELETATGGEQTIAVRVTDDHDNQSVEKLIVH